ncbi:MAG: type II secretion system protein [Ruthenibacterium sp.]
MIKENAQGKAGKQMRTRRGFTVVEILLVTAILLIITAFTVPKVYLKIEEAKEVAAFSTLHSVESIYRLTHTLMLIDPTFTPSEAYQSSAFIRHIPARYEETPRADALYYEAQIAYAFAEKPPCYEITETFTMSKSTIVIRYWPAPDKEPKRCYTLENGVMTRTDALRPKQKTG